MTYELKLNPIQDLYLFLPSKSSNINKYLNLLDNFIPMGIISWLSARSDNAKQTYEGRLLALEVAIAKLKREVLSNTMDIDLIRNKVLRKIQKRFNNNEADEADGAVPPVDGFEEVRKISKK